MSKRTWSILLMAALVASLFTILPAKAAHVPIPDEANIEDPEGDANALNDQGLGGTIGFQGDNSGGVNFANADIQKVWFTNTTDQISAHVLTTVPPPNSRIGLLYRVAVNDGCVTFTGIIPSVTYVGPQEAFIATNSADRCGLGALDEVPGEIAIEALDDGRGLTTLTFPMGSHPAIAVDAVLATAVATTRGSHGQASPALYVPQLDNTLPGSDYAITSGGQEPPGEDPGQEPPGKKDPPGKKKGCKKGGEKAQKKGCKKGKKGKKGKGKQKGPKTLSCETFTPGVEGAAEAEVLKVDDTHTEEAPLLIEYEHGPAGPSQARLNEELFFNVQSYSKAPEAGIYVLQEFADHSDIDLYLHDAAGEELTSSGAFNQAPVPGVLDSDGNGGMGFESISGWATPQCTGYTIRSNAYLTPGTDATLKIWLGEVAPPEE